MSEPPTAETNVCYCGAYGGGKHTKSARCDGSPEPSSSAPPSSKERTHTDTDRLERICGVVLGLARETKEGHAALSAVTLDGLKRLAQAALDASRAERVSGETSPGRDLFLNHAAIAAHPGPRRISMSFEKREHYDAALVFFDMTDSPEKTSGDVP